VPKAPKTPFWHFCHCLTLGISRYARRARVRSPSWWRPSVPDDQCLCRVSFNPLQCCIPRGASLCTPPSCCAALRSGNKTPSWNRSRCPRYVGDGERLDIRRLRQEYCSAPARLPGEVLSEIIGSCCGSYRLTYTDSGRADERTRTADLLLGVCGQWLLSVAGVCKSRLSKRLRVPSVARYCRALRAG
jgi:hypothetical protein